MAVSGSKVIKFTADNDVHDFGGVKTKLKGARLVASASGAATAKVRETNSVGQEVYSLAALTSTADESYLCTTIDTGKIHVDLSGTSAELYVYVE